MTPSDVRKRVAEIAELSKHDDEAAHCKEDQLHREVLQHFADEGYGLAIAALETTRLKFTRHCA